jgi:hypothetical protein
MSHRTGSPFRHGARKRAWTHLAVGAFIGLLTALPGAVGSVGFPQLAWSWGLAYFVLAELFSPPSIGRFWVTRRAGRWRLVTSEKDLSNTQRGFFLGLSGTLLLDAVAFFSVWAVVGLRAVLS